MSQGNVQVIVATLAIGIVVVAIAAAVFVAKRFMTVAQNISSLWLPVKTTADTLQDKLNLEKERIPDCSGLQHPELDNLIESAKHLLSDWNALQIKLKDMENFISEAGRKLFGLSTHNLNSKLVKEFPGVISAVADACYQGQNGQESLNALAHRSCELAAAMLLELDSITTARHEVSQECTLEEEQFEIFSSTNSDIYKLKRQILKFLDNVKPHMAKLSTRSFREQVRDQVLMDAPEVPQDQVELLLYAE